MVTKEICNCNVYDDLNIGLRRCPEKDVLLRSFASKVNVFSFVYFTLDDHYRVKEVFIILLIRRAIIENNQ